MKDEGPARTKARGEGHSAFWEHQALGHEDESALRTERCGSALSPPRASDGRERALRSLGGLSRVCSGAICGWTGGGDKRQEKTGLRWDQGGGDRQDGDGVGRWGGEEGSGRGHPGSPVKVWRFLGADAPTSLGWKELRNRANSSLRTPVGRMRPRVHKWHVRGHTEAKEG